MAEEVGAIAISFDHQISEGRIMRFHVGVAEDASAETLNRTLDKLTLAADRQAAKYELKAEQEKLAQAEKFYTLRQEELIKLDATAEAEYLQSNRKAPWSMDKLPPKDRALRQQTETMAQRLRDEIIASRQRVVELTAIQAGAASADRTTNSH